MNYSLVKISRFMDNTQHKTKETYQTTEYWEVWETHVKKLKHYLFMELTDNTNMLKSVNDHKREEKM
jgi:hypothetical protein